LVIQTFQDVLDEKDQTRQSWIAEW